MNIRIETLKLENFKCFRSKELSFQSDITTIRGRNGAGKTTIADAILFCLFGKSTEGQSDLELFKTRENGKVIPHLDHSVEIRLSLIDYAGIEKNVTLRRSIKEVWLKKRGSEESVFKNNTVEYFVNGESYTKADYEKYIASLVDERVFRAITNPTYFPSLKWQDQRTFLTQMVGDIEVPTDNAEFAAVLKELEGSDEDIVSYLKHLKYQIKQVKDKLDKIPVRLEEQNKALPEKLDWDALKAEYEDKSQLLKVVESDILSIKQGNGSDIQREGIRKLLEEAQKKFDAFDDKAHEEYNAEHRDKRNKINEASIKFNEALGNQKLMQQTIEADKRMIERCKETLEDCDKQLQKLREEWPTQKFEVDQNAGFCPTCGQPLPADIVEGKIEVMRQEFNQRKEAKKKELNERAAKIKQNIVDAQNEQKIAEDKLTADENALGEIKESVNVIFAEKAKLEKVIIKSPANRLAANEEAVGLYKQIEGMKQQLNAATNTDIDKEELTELESRKALYEETISNITKALALRTQYDKILALIDSINEEQKDLIRQLSELEKKEDVARQYQFRQNQLLEECINQHFSLVQWRLFRTVNNGGDSFDEPFCECYVDGVGYHSGLNQAARLNAGLDICETLCRFYNVSAPIVIDNAESNLDIYQTTGQQIRLFVSDCDLQLI